MFISSQSGILEHAGRESLRGAAQPPAKNPTWRPVGDRATLGVKDAVAQRDRGRPGIGSPNSRQSGVRPCAALSSHSQGRDGSMTPDAAVTWIGIDVAKLTLDVAWEADPQGHSFQVANSRE